MPGRRSLAAGLAGVLAVLALASGGIVIYLRTQVLDQERFQDRAVAALGERQVRDAIADRIVVEIINRGDPDLVTARPLLETAVSSLLQSEPFAAILRVAAADAHRLLFARDRDAVQLRIAGLASVVLSAVRSIDPQLAEQLPPTLDVQLAELSVSDFASGVPRLGEQIRSAAIWLPLGGLALIALCLTLAPSRRRAATALFVGGLAASVAINVLAAARPHAEQPVGRLTQAEVDGALSAAWWAFAGDLRTAAIVTGALSLAGVMMVAWRGPVPGAWRAGLVALTAPAPREVRARRALGLLAVAVGLAAGAAWAPELVLAGVALVVALTALDVGLGARRGEGAQVPLAVTRRGLLLVGSAIVVSALAATLVVSATRDARELSLPSISGSAAPGRSVPGCNGSPALCTRRLNEVVFAGTHNSMSAAASAGWVFTNQRWDIRRQLRDGIRLLLLDAHWGRRAGSRVRTDLAAEGSSRNRAARALGPRRTRLAEALAGDIGLGDLRGRSEVFLCHTLCELGATALSEVLEEVAAFLDANPSELLLISIESSVSSEAIQRAFDAVGLSARAAQLERDAPLPTLAELLAEGKQLIVFGDRDTGAVPWYLEADRWIQDTEIGARSCVRRTGDPSSPFVQVNHWIDSFPPRPSISRGIGSDDRLVERLTRCGRGFGTPVGLIAVDYYNETDVLGVARTLNGLG